MFIVIFVELIYKELAISWNTLNVRQTIFPQYDQILNHLISTTFLFVSYSVECSQIQFSVKETVEHKCQEAQEELPPLPLRGVRGMEDLNLWNQHARVMFIYSVCLNQKAHIQLFQFLFLPYYYPFSHSIQLHRPFFCIGNFFPFLNGSNLVL